MKVILLNSGVGERLLPSSEDTPKCLLEICGNQILGRELDCIKEYGINDIIITTGPFAEKIREYVAHKHPDVSVTYVQNNMFKETNYIYSLWLCKDLIDDDVLLLHGDVVLEAPVLKELLDCERESCVLVNRDIPPPEKDFKARIVDKRVKEIGVDVYGSGCFFMPPVYRFSKKDFKNWIKVIGEFVDKGNVRVYAENALNQILDEMKLTPVYYTGFCMEVDTAYDLDLAREYFSSRR